MAAWLQQRPFGFASVTPGKCQGTRGVGSRACLRPCLRGAHCSAGVRSGRPPFSCPAVASGRTDVGSISIRSSPSLLRSEMAFHCCWSLISILRVCPHFYADELFLVSLPTTFLNLLTLQSQISLKTHLPASLPPSPCPAAPSAPSAACSRPRPHCVVGSAFRLVKSTGSTSVTGSREAPFSLKRLSLRLRLSSLPCFLPFLQSLSSPLPAHACPVSVRIHQCSAAGSPV